MTTGEVTVPMYGKNSHTDKQLNASAQNRLRGNQARHENKALLQDFKD